MRLPPDRGSDVWTAQIIIKQRRNGADVLAIKIHVLEAES